MPEDTLEPSLPDCPHDTCPIANELETLRERVVQLEKHAQTDSLTGLFNKRFFDASLIQEIDRTGRTGLPTTLVLLDVDHFKSFNDTHGHVIGDKVLQHLAELLKANLRKLDIPCRYGGEEFAIILPSTPLLVAVQVAERLRSIIARSPLIIDHQHLEITASFGVDCMTHDGLISSEAFVRKADDQLYRAKKTGRNCVCHGTFTKKASHEVTLDEKNALR